MNTAPAPDASSPWPAADPNGCWRTGVGSAAALAGAVVAGWIAWGVVAVTVIFPVVTPVAPAFLAVLVTAAAATVGTAAAVKASTRSIVRGADVPAAVRRMAHQVLVLLVVTIAVSIGAMRYATHHPALDTATVTIAAAVVWVAVSIPVAMVIGRGIRIADTEATRRVHSALAAAQRITPRTPTGKKTS